MHSFINFIIVKFIIFIRTSFSSLYKEVSSFLMYLRQGFINHLPFQFVWMSGLAPLEFALLCCHLTLLAGMVVSVFVTPEIFEIVVRGPDPLQNMTDDVL